MTTDKLTPTHSFSHSGQAAAPSAHNKPQCQGAGAPTRVALPSLTLSPLIFLTSYPEETGTTGDPPPPWSSLRTGKPSLGLSTGVLSSSNMTLALWIKHDSHYHLQLFSLHFPDNHTACLQLQLNFTSECSLFYVIYFSIIFMILFLLNI